MFNKKKLRDMESLSDEINLPINEDNESKLMGLSWNELYKYGTLREDLLQSDNFITIIKEFISSDHTVKRKQTVILSKEDYRRYTKNTFSKEDVKREIDFLNNRIEDNIRDDNYEFCTELRDRRNFLENFLKI